MEPGENAQGAMKLDGDAEEVLFDFSVMLLEDLGSGSVRPMEFYQERFPGYEEEVAGEYRSICHVSPTELQGSVDMMDSEPRYLGDLRIGNYRVERELGRGGQATVYAAQDLRMDRSVALKVLSTTFGRVPPERMERFRREASAVASIDHPCICDVFEADFESEPPYIAMRLVPGDSIRQHIQRAMLIKVGELDAKHDPHLPCFPENEKELFTVLRVFERLARALHAAHEDSVIHRDIKPANVIIDESGTPMILDFGLARVGGEDSSTLTLTGEVFGTPAYMPPELLRGLVLEPGPSLDVYALAITLYECLTLKRPFDAGTPEAVYKQILEDEAPSVQEFHPDLPREVAIVIATAIEKDLKRRYASALDFAEELRRICEHEPIVAIPAGLGLRLKRWLQRHPALGTSIAGSILILVVGLTISLILLDKVAAERNRREDVVKAYDSLVGNVEAVHYREEARKKLMSDPVHALLLATEAFRVEPIELNHREVRRAMDLVHEMQRVSLPFYREETGRGYTQKAISHPTEPWIVYNDVGNNLWFHDLDSGETTRVIEGAPGTFDGMRIASDEERSNLIVCRNPGNEKASSGFAWIEVRTLNAAELRHRLEVEGERIKPLALNSQRVVTRCSDGRTILWDIETGLAVHEFIEEGTETAWASMGTGKDLLALGIHQEGEVSFRVDVWDMSAERRVAGLTDFTHVPWGATWSASQERLITYASQRASLWSLPDGQLVTDLEHDSQCRAGFFSADGSSLVTIAEGGEVRVWDGSTGAALHQLEGHDERAIIDASFSPGEGHLLATTSYDQTTRVWDVKTGESVRVFRGARARPTSAWWTGEGESLMCLEEKGVLHTWSLADPPWPRVFSASAGEVRGAWFVEGGAAVIVTTSEEVIEILDAQTGAPLRSHEWSAEDVEVLHVDDSREVVLAQTGDEPRLLEWSWETGAERVLTGAGPAILEVIPFGGGDPRHLVLTELGVLEAWDLDSDRWLYTIDPSELHLTMLQALVSESGRFIATGAKDAFVRIWSSDSGELLRELGPFVPENSNEQIMAMAFSRDEESIFAGCGDAHLREWSISTGELIGEISTHTTNQIVAVDSDHLLVSAQYSGTINLFDLRKGWSFLSGQQTEASSVASISIGNMSGSPIDISSDRRNALFSDARTPVRLLELHHLMPTHPDRGRVIRGSFSIDPQVEVQTDHLSSAVFSPDGQLVLAVGSGRAWIWPTDIGAAAEEICPVGIEFFNGFPSLGLTDDAVK